MVLVQWYCYSGMVLALVLVLFGIVGGVSVHWGQYQVPVLFLVLLLMGMSACTAKQDSVRYYLCYLCYWYGVEWAVYNSQY